MAANTSTVPPIVLYHYSFSPYARRIAWYLQLRQIPYAECRQPPIMPRPDLSAKLGINYRRIPVMSIGKDVYCDTRIIIDKLEALFPGDGTLSGRTSEHLAIQSLLSKWMTEGGIFFRSSQLIPTSAPLLSDAKFTKDREQLTGRKWDKASVERNRPEALAVIRDAFHTLENGLLSDGRSWIFGGDKPSLGDIEGIWCFHWLTTLPGALPENIISAKQFPKVYSWIGRFNKALQEAGKQGSKPKKLNGDEAAAVIFKANFVEESVHFDQHDPSGVTSGVTIEVWPVDSGFSHRDVGKLLSLTEKEIVIGLENGLHLHYPRTGFRFREANKQTAEKL